MTRNLHRVETIDWKLAKKWKGEVEILQFCGEAGTFPFSVAI